MSPTTASGSAPPPPTSSLPPKPAAKLPPLIAYTGIPRISLPTKLPHRNWFIFAAVVTIPTYLWWDDRRQAAEIKAAYIQRVKHLAEQPMPGGALGRVRTATVYASRWPGEEDGKARDWWKRYMKVRSRAHFSVELNETQRSSSPVWRPPHEADCNMYLACA